jgi:Ca2+:H+ antiporter
MVGALLANLLVALGFSFLLGEPRRHGQEYNPNAIRTYSSTMVLAWISLALPSAFHSALEAEPHLGVHATLAFVATIVLLGLYGLFLLYSLRTHPEIFAELNAPASQETIGEHPALHGHCDVVGRVAPAWIGDILAGAAEEAGQSLGMS